MNGISHYKSWSGLNRQLSDCLCDSLRGRITYFLTRYHEVHNAYGRASIRLDGKETVCFSWADETRQEADRVQLWRETRQWEPTPEMKEKWDRDATLSDTDFLRAATDFLSMPISDALASPSALIRVFAILDRRVGARTLQRIREAEEYKTYPDWVQTFYRLRLGIL